MDVDDRDDAPATRGELRTTGEELKGVIGALRDELKGETAVLRRDFALETVKTHSRVDRLEASLRKDIRSESSRVIKIVEDFAAQVGKVDRAQVIADWRLTELDKRVKALESRPS